MERILVGVVLMVAGRQLYWLLVGGLGFYLGMKMAAETFAISPPEAVLIIGLVAGLAGALLSVFLQRITIGVVGALAGGWALEAVLLQYGVISQHSLLAWIIGGIAGLLCLTAFFEWTLVALTSLLGAYLVVENLELDTVLKYPLLIVLFVIAAVLQYTTAAPPSEREPPKESAS